MGLLDVISGAKFRKVTRRSLVVVLDAAHGIDVPGKRSPDGMHMEYVWSRMICKQLGEELAQLGFTVCYTVTGDDEPGLTTRVKRGMMFPAERKLFLSLHNNAAGNGMNWMRASGVEIFTSPGQNKADKCAEIIIQQLRNDFPELKFRLDHSDGDADKEARFTVINTDRYWGVLLEWLFQDNLYDCVLLRNAAYNKKLVKSLVNAVLSIEKMV